MTVSELWTALNPTMSEVRSYQGVVLIAPNMQRYVAKTFEGFSTATFDSGHSTYQMRVEGWTVEDRSAVRLVFEQFKRGD